VQNIKTDEQATRYAGCEPGYVDESIQPVLFHLSPGCFEIIFYHKAPFLSSALGGERLNKYYFLIHNSLPIPIAIGTIGITINNFILFSNPDATVVKSLPTGRLPAGRFAHSVRNDFTGLAMAAFID